MKTSGGVTKLARTATEESVFHLSNTGQICFVRFRLARPLSPEGFSKKHHVGFVHWHGGAAIGVISESRHGGWVAANILNEPKNLRGCIMPYQVLVGCGERTLRNAEDAFYFAILPPQVATLTSPHAQLDTLAQWVYENFVVRERQEFRAKAQAMNQERLKKFPPRLPHEPSDVDHHRNRRDVVLNLLRKEWPQLSRAIGKLGKAKTEQEKQRERTHVYFAYIADYTVLYGTRPAVNEGEEAELWRHDYFIRLMNEALVAPRGRVDKRDWQLANGWIEKGYYRMNETELEATFIRDWNYPPQQQKGNTLAKRAHRIGLHSALKRGRPEKPNALPPG